MSREIKFRVWDKDAGDNGTMIHWEYAKDSSYFQNALSGNYPLMQYTGLKDNNGVEIYHKDIVSNGISNYVVVWSGDAWKIQRGAVLHYIGLELIDLEVIGNIHQHPELLR